MDFDSLKNSGKKTDEKFSSHPHISFSPPLEGKKNSENTFRKFFSSVNFAEVKKKTKEE
jgi:hypothetical protein